MALSLIRPAPPSADALPGTVAVVRADGSGRPDGSARPDGSGPGRRAGDGGPPALVRRARLAVVCAGFVGLLLVQQPGRIVADTKLDVVVDPWGFLGRALSMWEPQGFAGQVQNQAYGYLFPMGPFFGVLESIGLPPWVVQRLWMAGLLCAAFLGFVALAGRLGLGGPGLRLLGGLAYALAPRMITGIGAVSIEVLPMALAPWVLVPLVTGATRGSPRRAAALSGLAVFCVGGVNAVATAAVLPLAALWLLTRPAGRRRRRLMAWWVASVALATTWWAGALLLLGSYSPPFLNYIESAGTTTVPTELTQTLRGTSHWVAYLATAMGPQWPAGWSLVKDAVPIVGTVVLAAAGLAALTLRTLPERRWMVSGLLAGVVLVSLGHLSTIQGIAAGPLHEALDGVLAPLRNVHKWDPVLRLPLTLALTYLGTALLARAHERGAPGRAAGIVRVGAPGVAVLLAVGLLASVSPALAGRLTPPGGAESIPGYWQATANWLAERDPHGRALLLPASSVATYSWGNVLDEPMQALARAPWEVRNAIPFTPAGHIRMLDAVGAALQRGKGSAGLARYLARSGISYVVVRNDLDTGAADATRPLLLHRALADSPGLRRVTTFGPLMPAAPTLFGVSLDAGLAIQRPAVEVYAVEGAAAVAYTTPLEDAVTVLGGPDGVLALEQRGLLTGRPALLPDGDAPPQDDTMVSDSLVRRERTVGRINDATSAGLTADAPRTLDTPAPDYLIDGHAQAESVVRLEGGTVRASSARSDADTFGLVRPEDQPFAALDGDVTTAWRPADRLGRPEPVWWEVSSDRPLVATSLSVTLAVDPTAPPPTRLLVRTDAGERTVPLAATAEPQRFALPAGITRTVRLEAAPEGRGAPALALAEVRVPGLHVRRSVATPAPSAAVAAYAFDAANPGSSGCVAEPGGPPRCAASLVAGAEEPSGLSRTISVAGPAAYDVSLTAVPRAGASLDALIAGASGLGAQVSASSSAVPDPRGDVLAAFDGDPGTTWVAAPGDDKPTLTLRFDRPRTVDRLRVVRPRDGAASVPTAVTVHSGWYQATLDLDEDGAVSFAPQVTDELTVSFPFPAALSSFDPYTRMQSPLGVGIGELQVGGLNAPDPAAVVDIPCGRGPVVTLDGRAMQTQVRTTLNALRTLQPMRPTICSGPARTPLLAPGEHSFAATRTDVLAVDAATLVRAGSEAALGRRSPAGVRRWDAEHRVVAVGARSDATLLVVPENVNDGWTATLGGVRLAKVTVDGWQQGYVLPAGAAGEVHLDFGPGSRYRAGLLAGLVAVAVLLLLVMAPVRRPGPPPGGRRGRGVVGAVAGLGAMLLLAGPIGLGAALVLGLYAALARRRRAVLLAGVAAIGMLTAGALLLVAPGVATEPIRQASAAVGLAAVAASLLPMPSGTRRSSESRRSGTSERQRRSGRSTSS